MRAGLIFLSIMFAALAAGAGQASVFQGAIVGKDGDIRKSRSALAVLARHEGKVRLTLTMDYSGGGHAELVMSVPENARIVEEGAPGLIMLSRFEEYTSPSMWVGQDEDPCAMIISDYGPLGIDTWSFCDGREGGTKHRSLPMTNDFAKSIGQPRIIKASDDDVLTSSAPITAAGLTGGHILVAGFDGGAIREGYVTMPPVTIEYSADTLDFDLNMKKVSDSSMSPLDITLIVVSDVGLAKPVERPVVPLQDDMQLPAAVQAIFQRYYDAIFSLLVSSGKEGSVFQEYYRGVQWDDCPDGESPKDILRAMGAGWIEKQGKNRVFVTRLHYLASERAGGPLRMKEVKTDQYQRVSIYTKTPFEGPTATCNKGQGYMSRFMEEERKKARQVPSGILPPDWDKDLTRAAEVVEIFDAAATGDLEKVKRAVEAGADINMKGSRGMTLLCAAASGGAANVVEWLIAHRADKDAPLSSISGSWKYTPLQLAIFSGQAGSIEALARGGVDINKPDENGIYPIFNAAERYDMAPILTLLSLGADINVRGADGKNVLYYAARIGQQHNNWNVFKALLEKGAELDLSRGKDAEALKEIAAAGAVDILRNALDKGEKFDPKSQAARDALLQSVQNNQRQAAQLLLERGVSVNGIGKGKNDEDTSTPLLMAMEKGHLELAEYLLDRGADPAAAGSDGHTPLLIACQSDLTVLARRMMQMGAKDPNVTSDCLTLGMAASKGDLEAARAMLASGAGVNITDNDYATPLMKAVENGDLAMARLLTQAGADIIYRGQWSLMNNVLSPAVEKGSLEMIRLLVESAKKSGMEVEVFSKMIFRAAKRGDREIFDYLVSEGIGKRAFKTDCRDILLIDAATGGLIDLVKRLLDEGADPDVIGDDQSPLMAAAEAGHIELVKFLLEAGADVNRRKDLGMGSYSDMAITSAARGGHADIVLLLLERGADPDGLSNRNSSALYHSVENDDINIARIMLAHGASPNVFGLNEMSPLMLAAEKGSVTMLKLLLEHDPDTALLDREGMTALDYAFQSRNPEAINLLIHNKRKYARLVPFEEFKNNPIFSKQISLSPRENNPGSVLRQLRDSLKIQIYVNNSVDELEHVSIGRKRLSGLEALEILTEKIRLVAALKDGRIYVGHPSDMTLYNREKKRFEFGLGQWRLEGFNLLIH